MGHTRGILALLFGTLSWGLLWYPYRILDSLNLSGVHASLLSFLVTFLIALIFYRLKNFNVFKTSHFWFYALIGGITNISYVLAIIHGEVVRVMLLFFLSPVWTLPLSLWLLKEKVQVKNIWAALLSLLGGFIVLWHPQLFNENLGLSDLYALIAGLGFALTNVMARYYSHMSFHDKSYAIWFGVIIFAAIVTLIFDLKAPSEIFNGYLIFIVMIVGLTLFITTLVVQFGLTQVNAVTASPIFLFEIIVAGISAYFLANEIVHVKDFFGGLLIVLGVLISTRE